LLSNKFVLAVFFILYTSNSIFAQILPILNQVRTLQSENRKLLPAHGQLLQNFEHTISKTDTGYLHWETIYSSATTGRGDHGYAICFDNDGNYLIAAETGAQPAGSSWLILKYSIQGDLLWEKKIAGQKPDFSYPFDIITDNLNNVYVCGIGINQNWSQDILIVKLNQHGEMQWEKWYDGPDQGTDIPFSLKLYNNGLLAVTGVSYSIGDGNDVLTLCYDTNGNELWQKRYHNFNLDEGYESAFDSQGNLLVAGVSESSITGMDYLLLKYSPTGDLIWQKHFDGPQSSLDVATAIAVGPDDHIYLSGYATGNDFDYMTLRLDPSGDIVWEKIYDGPVGYNDVATDIVLDNTGNLIVTGWTRGDSTRNDFATLKYSPNGDEEWISFFNTFSSYFDEYPADIEVDCLDNIYIAGENRPSDTDLGGDYITIKLDTSGQQQWLHRYEGPTDKSSYATSMVVSCDGYALVTGSSFTINTSYDVATLRYSPQGSVNWLRRYDGLAGARFTGTFEAAYDEDFNSYQVGRTYGTNQLHIVKTDRYGNIVWTKNSSQTPGVESPIKVAVNNTGRIAVITERFNWSSSDFDYYTVCFDTSGNELWGNSHPSTHGDSKIGGVVITDDNSVYVTGTTDNADDGITTIKYDGQGNIEWMDIFNDHLWHWDFDILQDQQDNLLVYGSAAASLTDQKDKLLIRKLAPDGSALWSILDTPFSNLNIADTWMTSDVDGNYISISVLKNDSGPKDVLICKYSSDGVRLWEYRYGHTAGNYDDFPLNIDVDADKNIYVYIGSFTPIQHQPLPVLLKYSPDGTLLWEKLIMESASVSSPPLNMILDTDENPVILHWHLYGTSWGIKLKKYDTNGNSLQEMGHVFLDDESSFAPTAIASNDLDEYFISARLRKTGSEGYILMSSIKLSTNPVGIISDNPTSVPTDFTLEQNYPNPFNPSTTIGYTLPFPADIQIEAYNILGQRVAVIAEGNQQAGNYSIRWEPAGQSSGIYFYTLKTDGKIVQTRRMLYMK